MLKLQLANEEKRAEADRALEEKKLALEEKKMQLDHERSIREPALKPKSPIMVTAIIPHPVVEKRCTSLKS